MGGARGPMSRAADGTGGQAAPVLDGLVANVCFDDDPAAIVVTQSRRDASLNDTDSARMVVDDARGSARGQISVSVIRLCACIVEESLRNALAASVGTEAANVLGLGHGEGRGAARGGRDRPRRHGRPRVIAVDTNVSSTRTARRCPSTAPPRGGCFAASAPRQSRSLVVSPDRCPVSRSACRSHLRSVSTVFPSFVAPRLQRRPLRRVRRALLHHQPDGALTHFR